MKLPRRSAAARTLREWGEEAWPLLPRTAAATVAWLIARFLVGNHDPFFAPISAVVALNAPIGERGSNAVRLLLGVIVGIVVGELAVTAIGGGYVTLALSTFAAMALARALGGARIIIAQAAIGAILTVTVADGHVGVDRLVDALIGGGVALVFSQVVFSPEPVGLLRRAEAKALRGMAEGLAMTAQALDQHDDERSEHAIDRMRDVRDSLVELARLRRAGRRVARHSAIWRSQMASTVRETEDAGYLDLLGGSCLMLARVATQTSVPERLRVAPVIHELATVLDDLADDLGGRSTRQDAADRALDAIRGLDQAPHSVPSEAARAARMVAADIMTFTGVDPQAALDAARAGTGAVAISAPPSAPRLPFGLGRRRPR